MTDLRQKYSKQNTLLVSIQERMKKSECYLFNNIRFSDIPMFAQEKLADIFLDFEKQYNKSEPTVASLLHAAHIVLERKTSNKNEWRAYWASLTLYKKLMVEAFTEYKNAKFPILYEYTTLTDDWKLNSNIEIPYNLQRIIFIDHLLRYPYKLIAAQRVSRLRSKVRKYKNLSKGASVGF
ncbi:MAG: hypothetical protein ACLRFF_01135 [Alphaproteobacteria bacterium]